MYGLVLWACSYNFLLGYRHIYKNNWCLKYKINQTCILIIFNIKSIVKIIEKYEFWKLDLYHVNISQTCISIILQHKELYID